VCVCVFWPNAEATRRPLPQSPIWKTICVGGKLLSGSMAKRSERNFQPKAADVARITGRVKAFWGLTGGSCRPAGAYPSWG